MAAKGQPKTGGRKKGTPNKATTEIKTLARAYGTEAIEKLAKLMRGQYEHIDRLIDKLACMSSDDKKTREIADQLLTKLEERNVQNELAASRELLDRGYGKPAQAISGPDGEEETQVRIIMDFGPRPD